MLSLVLGSAAFLAVVINVLFALGLGLETGPVLEQRALCHGGVLVLSLAMYCLTRSQLPRERLLQLGLVYEVVGAWGVTLPNLFDQGFLQEHFGRITWLCIWITLFPVLLPTSGRRKLITALLAASAVPGVMFLAWLGGTPAPPPRDALGSLLPPYVCAGLALAAAGFLRQAEAELRRAQAAVEHLGSYRLIERLGKGAMGEVWRGEHALLARPAAIKVVRARSGRRHDPARQQRALERFRREAEMLASLSSPHTVQLYDYGVTSRGRPYLVMELLDGIDLDTLVERFGPVPPERALYILEQATRSLEEAHAAGLVHRDVKPANICVCRAGMELDYVKVLDFGLGARLREAAELDDRGMAVGTPLFMAPEAVRGEEPDPRSDIYSLGCVAYWLLAGSFLFEGETTSQVMSQQLVALPPPLETFASDVPDEVEQLVLRCLAKQPALRYQSAAELGAALRACADGLYTTWTPARASAWWAEHLPRAQGSPPALPPAEPDSRVATALDPSRAVTDTRGPVLQPASRFPDFDSSADLLERSGD